MKMFPCKFAQDEVTTSKPAGLFKTSVQSCPKSLEGKAAHGLAYPAGDLPCFTRGAYAEYVSAHDAKSVKSVRPKAEKWRPACAKPLRRRQGTPLAAFFNRSLMMFSVASIS
jgi:hypothetical protein